MNTQKVSLNAREWRVTLGLGGVFALRMLGLFLVLPVLSLYAYGLAGATPFLAGVSVGIYGLTQALFQIPFGALSDLWGRKQMIVLGLLIFALGSTVAAFSQGIYGLLLGRALQGSGAVASVVIALLADLTREEVRARSMAVVGMCIGLSFGLGVLGGPLWSARYGVASLFILTAVLCVLGILYLLLGIPDATPIVASESSRISPTNFLRVLRDSNLFTLDLGMFLLHGGMTAVFVVTPFLLKEHYPRQEFWKAYVPMILIGGGAMFPAVYWAETRGRIKEFLLAGSAIMVLGFGILWGFSFERAGLVSGLVVYFIGFNFLEPILPSLVTRCAHPSLRGTAVGVFSTGEFLGAFVGGALGGWFLGHGVQALFPCLGILAFFWMAVAWKRLQVPAYRSV
ncbi:MAG: MFS transporter [Elusimicrobia bacterium]|nr:MFS transporter [Elusimicrobiota bacterium]